MANQTNNEDLPIAPVPVMRGNEEMLPSTEFRQAVPDWEGEEVHLRDTPMAPSRILNERSTSIVKSTCPGVSMI